VWYTTRKVLTLVNAVHIAASVFINDDERGLHHDYEVRLEKLAPHAPIEQYWHKRTGEACPTRSRGGQCGRAPEEADHGPQGRGGGHQRPPGRLD
jgi:hypothetical protein